MSRNGYSPAARAQPGTARIAVDAEGRIERWGPDAEALLGYPPAEVLGRPVTVLLAGDEVGGAQASATGAVLRHRDGLPVEVDIGITPEPGQDGPAGWSLLLTAASIGHLAEVDRAVLRALFTESPIGLFVLDPQLRVVRFNTAAHGMRGLLSEDVIGRRLREVAPGVVTDAIKRILQHVMDTGDPVTDFVQPGYPPADPDQERVYSMSALRLQDQARRVLGVAGVVIDATERYRARSRVDLLMEASVRIGTTLDVVRTAEELAEVAVPRVADSVAVDVLDSVYHGEAPGPGPVGDQVTLRRTAYRSPAEGGPESVVPVGEVAAFPFPTPFTQCLTDLLPRLIPHVDADTSWLDRVPRFAEEIREGGVHSMMVVPLTARGVILGLVSFLRWETPGAFDEDDLTIAGELAARAAVCVDNARRYTREHTAALTLQRNLVPQHLPAQTAVDAAHVHLPEGAGAEWFDVIPLPGARVALVVGEVTDHGIPAVATVARLRTGVQSLAALDLAPDDLLAHLADLTARLTEEGASLAANDPLQSPPPTATCVLAVYDPVSREVVLARAGHPAPLVAHPDGSTDLADVPEGPALSAEGMPYQCGELRLPAGSLLALYTRGLLSSAGRGDPSAGLRRLQRQLGEPRASVQDTCDAVVYSLPERPDQDVVLLLARTRALPADRVAFWTLPTDPAIVATSRTLVARQLGIWDLPDLVFTAQLVVSELVTNAIRYGTPPIQLRLILDQVLICEVSDGNSAAPHVRHPRASDEGGRGLLLVAQLAKRWGTRLTPGGKTIWAEQPLAVPEPG